MNINDCSFNIKIYISHCAIINLDKKYSTRTKRPRTYTAQGNFCLHRLVYREVEARDIGEHVGSRHRYLFTICKLLVHAGPFWYDVWGVKQGAQTSPGWIPLNPSSKKPTPSFIPSFSFTPSSHWPQYFWSATSSWAHGPILDWYDHQLHHYVRYQGISWKVDFRFVAFAIEELPLSEHLLQIASLNWSKMIQSWMLWLLRCEVSCSILE